MLLNIISSLFKEPKTASEIAREQNLNQKSVANHLNKLESQSILTTHTQGKNKLFLFNDQLLTFHFLCSIEHQRTIEFYKKHPKIKQLIRKLPQEGMLILFGSYAKDEQQATSDIDLLHINNKKIDFSETIQKYSVSVDIKHYKTYTNDPLIREVIKNHIVLNGIEAFVRAIWNDLLGANKKYD